MHIFPCVLEANLVNTTFYQLFTSLLLMRSLHCLHLEEDKMDSANSHRKQENKHWPILLLIFCRPYLMHWN